MIQGAELTFAAQSETWCSTADDPPSQEDSRLWDIPASTASFLLGEESSSFMLCLQFLRSGWNDVAKSSGTRHRFGRRIAGQILFELLEGV